MIHSDRLLVIAIKPKAKYKFHATVIYVLHFSKKIILLKLHIVQWPINMHKFSILYYVLLLYRFTYSCVSHIVLLIIRNQNVQIWDILQWYNINAKFHQTQSTGHRVETCEQTDTTSFMCINFLHMAQRKHKTQRISQILKCNTYTLISD
jgi:hypothetical protein